jgi:hypothetical protein
VDGSPDRKIVALLLAKLIHHQHVVAALLPMYITHHLDNAISTALGKKRGWRTN